MSDTTSTVADATPDLGIDVWYENPETGATFGFGLPLPKQVVPQVRAGNIVPVAAGGVEPPAAAVPEADGDGAAGTGEDPALYPCETCGDTAVKDPDGFYTDFCAKHTPKPTTSRGRK